jgi:hypothetical protein
MVGTGWQPSSGWAEMLAVSGMVAVLAECGHVSVHWH